MVRNNTRSRCTRLHIGRVSIYRHHGAWWLYYRQHDRAIRRRIGDNRDAAERVAAEINAQLTNAAPTLFDFRPIGIVELRAEFLAFHENVQRSSISTVRRYAAATQHLVNFAEIQPRKLQAHEISANGFIVYLRSLHVAPNGHANSSRRSLRDKGVQFIVESCRSMYGFAQRQRHLPPYAANPFAELRIDRMRIEDAKPIFVFDTAAELRFLQAAPPWDFPVHFTLAQTGLRSGELCHLLIEDLDLAAGWLYVRNKPELGWSVKTRNERKVPLHSVLVELLRVLVGERPAGVVFHRRRYRDEEQPEARANRRRLVEILHSWWDVERKSQPADLDRRQRARIARRLWRAAGALDPDEIRNSFLRIARRSGMPAATCPKSWRHSFATLLQDANVDPLLRQITLGHQPSGAGGALGMTGVYTHSRPETHAREICRAVNLKPESLEWAQLWAAQRGEMKQE